MAKRSEVEVIKFGDINKAVFDGNERSLKEVAIATAAQAKELAPVDLGQLKNSIMWKLANNNTGGFNNSGGKLAEDKLDGTPPKGEAWVGSNLEYAGYQEFGTRRMAAQPFLRPAVDIIVKGGDVQKIIEYYESDAVKNEIRSGKKVVKF